jgi:hypothetical protein
VRFRTGYEPIAVKGEIRAHGWNETEKKDSGYYHNDSNSKKG